MRLNRTTLFLTVEVLVLVGAGFGAGYLWPHAGPDPVLSRTPPQAELALAVSKDGLGGTAPANSTLTVGGDTIKAGEMFNLAGAGNLQWWTDDWAVSLKLPEFTAESLTQPVSANTGPAKAGRFVASSSGTKYHPATGCSYADRIKEENRVYFDTEEQAKAAGYEPSSCITK